MADTDRYYDEEDIIMNLSDLCDDSDSFDDEAAKPADNSVEVTC